MRQKDLKYFGDLQSGRLNADDSPFAITTNEWVNAQNIRTGTTDKGVTGVVESIGGNVEISQPANLASVIIGNQKWSAQNLNVDKYRNGENILEITDQTTWDAATIGAWCWYNFDSATGIRLYNWFAVNDPRGLSPQGWWIPTLYEWKQLSNYLGGNSVSGGHLKEIGTDHWNSPNTGADNSSRFTALGCGFNRGGFNAILETGAFWTATQNAGLDTKAELVYLRYDSSQIYYDNSDKRSGFSVRAITFNSQYITIGSVEDTENKRFVYFNYDTVRNHQVPITNISIFSLGGSVIFTFDGRASLLKAGDTIIITSGSNAGTYTISSISINGTNDSYMINLGVSLVADTYTTDIIYNVAGEDKIVCMNTDTNIQYNVLLSSQVTGGLNFDKNSLIHSAHIANNILSFPDGINNEPRKINIESAISGNYPSFVTDSHTYKFPLDFSEITLIKRPPAFTPFFYKDYDSLFLNNYIENNSFEFAFQYQYYDSETTVIGCYSNSTRLNYPPISPATTTDNRVVISMSFEEFIPDTVKIVNLIVRNSDSNYAFIAKSWDKNIASELNEIENHNNNISNLDYQFYNNTTGIIIPDYDVLRPFDNVPIYSQTHEIAKQRYFLANNIDGYDAPLTTSMQLSIGSYIIPSNGTRQADMYYINHWGYITTLFGVKFASYGYGGWYVYLPWAQTPGYYLCNGFEITNQGLGLGNIHPTPPAPPTSPILYSNLTFKGLTWSAVINATTPGAYRNYNNTISSATSVDINGVVQDVYNVFPQLSTYKSGVVFYDYAMRKCGVVTNNDCIVDTPNRNYDGTVGIPDSLSWTLDNTFALDEIPDWAYYYAPVLTKNQSKRFFVQGYSNGLKYAFKNQDGTYNFTNPQFNLNSAAIAVNISNLTKYGLGYVFTEGDVCILTKYTGVGTSDFYVLPIIGQESDFVLLRCKDIGDLTNVKFIYELNTPYKSLNSEPFYEMGQIYKINNPKSIYRKYSDTQGFFISDSYLLNRPIYSGNYYLAMGMSPNDTFYKNWYTDTGKVNIVTRLGQADNNTEVVWSDTYISGTQINGSSTFRLGSQSFVSDDCGSITKLQNTSKVQDQGTIMLALCTTESNSMYLGETQILDSTGATQFFSAGTNVIGTINILKGNYGCIDPASVVQYRGHVYYLDANNGRWVQYSENGLDNISAIKMSRFWKNWCYKYLSLTKNEIEAFGNRPYVFATVDPSHDELLVSIPKLSDVPPKGFLPDYPLTVYPFDILDYQGKTISYKLGTGAVVTPHWQSAYTFNTEYFCTIQNRLFSFKNGNAWEHNQNIQNVFYNEYFPSRIMFTSNILPQIPKVYDNFLSEANLLPAFVYFYNEFPYLQTSDLYSSDFVQKEGIWYAQILRNKVVPTNTGDTYTGLLTAEVMRNTNMFVDVYYSPYSTPLQLRILELGMSISKGHIV